jgi:hypothetical protein
MQLTISEEQVKEIVRAAVQAALKSVSNGKKMSALDAAAQDWTEIETIGRGRLRDWFSAKSET